MSIQRIVQQGFLQIRPQPPKAELGSGLILPDKTLDRVGAEGVGTVVRLGPDADYDGLQVGSTVLYRQFYQDVHRLPDGTSLVHKGDILAELSGSGSVGYGEHTITE